MSEWVRLIERRAKSRERERERERELNGGEGEGDDAILVLGNAVIRTALSAAAASRSPKESDGEKINFGRNCIVLLIVFLLREVIAWLNSGLPM